MPIEDGVFVRRQRVFQSVSFGTGSDLSLHSLTITFSYLYQIENLGDDDESQIEYESKELLPQGDEDVTVFFNPRELRNLALVDEMESLAPLIDAKILNLTEDDSPQIYALCGRGARSTFRMLRHGLEVSEMAVSELPGHPNAVWTLKANARGERQVCGKSSNS